MRRSISYLGVIAKFLDLKDLYDGIDLVCSASGGALRFSFIVDAGADPGDVRLRWEGDAVTESNGDGGLDVTSPLGSLRMTAPDASQGERAVKAGFASARGEERLLVGESDRASAMQVESWITYFGGSVRETGGVVDTDANGNVLLIGVTDSPDLPVRNAYQSVYAGNNDYFFVKYSSAGTRLCTSYLGGS